MAKSTKRPMLSRTKFKTWCKEQGMGAQEVADRLDISISLVYKYWQGIVKPTREVEMRMVKVFGFNTKDMFDII